MTADRFGSGRTQAATVDLFEGDRVELKQFAREEGVAYSTTWRWALKGIAGIRLPTQRLGNKRYTSRAAISWWSEQITAAADGQRPVDAESPRRQKQIEAAEQQLQEQGISISPRSTHLQL